MAFTQFLPNTAAGRTILAAADAAAQRTALELGTADSPTFASSTLAGQSLTGSQDLSLLDLSTTWNTSGTPTAIKMNVTDTASASGSLLMDLQVGGSRKFSVNKSGVVTGGASYYLLTSAITSFQGHFAGSTKGTFGAVNGADWCVRSTGDFGWSSITSATGTVDTHLYRDAAGIVAQRYELNAQASRIYNTFTDASNGEWFEIDWQTTSNVLRLATNNNGTGTKRNIVLDSANRSAYIAAPTNAEIRDILISFGLMAAS